MKEVLSHPHPILDNPTNPVTDLSLKHLLPIIEDIIETIVRNDALGLAANQIGYAESVIGVRIQKSDKINIYVNPVIVGHSDKTTKRMESCLSSVGVEAEIERWATIQFTHYCYKKMKVVKEQLAGMAARAFQHEMDHLRGLKLVDHGVNKVKLAHA